MTAKEKESQLRHIAFWRESARHDRETAQSLCKLKHYDWCLFIYHLAIEKLLKALIIAAEATPPYTHDLERLADLAVIKPSADQTEWLREITKYNIEARYPEEKHALYHKATPEYATQWQKNCDQVFLWLEELLDQAEN